MIGALGRADGGEVRLRPSTGSKFTATWHCLDLRVRLYRGQLREAFAFGLLSRPGLGRKQLAQHSGMLSSFDSVVL